MLGDLGAEVIKVEQRGAGDPSRHNAPRYRNGSVYFHSVNGNKQSVTINRKAPGARTFTNRLISASDVMLESFSVSVAAKHGNDGAAAHRINPKPIYCSITGYGQTGSLSSVPGHELVVQAATGLLAPGNSAPQMPGFQTADCTAGLITCVDILAALRRRDIDGIGAALDISMFDSMLQLGQIGLGSAMARFAGASGDPAMEVWGGNPRYALYPTRDGKTIAVALLVPRYWKKFCTAIDQPDLSPEHADPSARLSTHGERAELYRKAIADYYKAHDRDEIARRMAAEDIPLVPVLTPDEALHTPHAAERQLVRTVAHASEGKFTELRNPLHPSGLVRTNRTPAPELGADNSAVLRRIGFTGAEITDLAKSGTI
jgi:crotonobetainyl-CoA:carnitine CoA-transferase CaiB-like acyl-CoA transferase